MNTFILVVMAKLYTYKSIIFNVVLLLFALQLQAQPSASAANNLLFKTVFCCVLLALIHVPFLLLAFFYAANGHKYNDKERKSRIFSLAILAVFNGLLLLYSFLQAFYFIPFFVLTAVPVCLILMAQFYGHRPFLTWLLSMFYILNLALLASGGIDNPEGFGPKHGTYYQYHSSDKQQISTKQHFSYGAKQGLWEYFHVNGQLSAQFNYQNGLLEGTAKEYYDNGHLKSSYQFKNNAIEGQYLSFYRNKQPETKRKFKNGLLEGIEKIYFENGNLSSLFNYKKGEKYGICKVFFPNGKLKSALVYSSEPKDCSIYYSDGQLKGKGSCIGQQKVGLWELYHPNGNLSETGFYASSDFTSSMKQGLWKSYHSNGQLQTIGEYIQGIRHGPWKKYFSDGSLSDSKNY